jgi:hypothetical protein
MRDSGCKRILMVTECSFPGCDPVPSRGTLLPTCLQTLSQPISHSTHFSSEDKGTMFPPETASSVYKVSQQSPPCKPQRNLNRLYSSWLRHYDTSWKVAGSITDEVIGFFNSPNPSSHTMALVSTQPLTEMSTRDLPGSKRRPVGA